MLAPPPRLPAGPRARDHAADCPPSAAGLDHAPPGRIVFTAGATPESALRPPVYRFLHPCVAEVKAPGADAPSAPARARSGRWLGGFFNSLPS